MVYQKLAKLSEELQAVSKVFGNLEEHPVVLAAEEVNETVLAKIIFALVNAEDSIKEALSYIEDLKKDRDAIDTEGLEEMAFLAAEFDQVPALQKHAAVIDQLLINFAQKDEIELAKKADEAEIERLRAKLHSEKRDELYHNGKKIQDERNKAADAAKAIHEQIKTYKPLEAPLSTRNCPEHGALMMRVADNVYQCSMDKKIYSYSEGYKLNDGTAVPGTSVAEQNAGVWDRGSTGMSDSMAFSSRESKTR